MHVAFPYLSKGHPLPMLVVDGSDQIRVLGGASNCDEHGGSANRIVHGITPLETNTVML
jgi:hypothetical protein